MSILKIKECLKNKTNSYIRPIIWYGGESIELLVKEIHAIKKANIKEFILENRGGDWFLTPKWYELMKIALETAKNLGMRMWILDDSHVNSGSANDSLKKEENSKFRAKNLRIEFADFAGPIKAGALLLPNMSKREKVIRVTAFLRDEKTGHSIGEGIDLTNNINDGLCLVDLDSGIWRVYFILTSDPARQGLFANYITMVSKESCRHLIDEVHEKIYKHFAPYFGNTFAGFFSDEPAFGNCDGQYGYDTCEHRMGQVRRLYPWWDDFPEKLAKKANMSIEQVMVNLPALWDNVDEYSPLLRLAYMDLITQLWQENFSCQIGKWCEERNVEYIGHNIEDRGAHMRTGWGCGHFFRSMAGQHMAGIDIVLNQHVPGIRSINHAANTSNKEYISSFYSYTLPKLAPSLAHVMPHMKNRAICEVFGAYGWTCGLSVMKNIFNLFLTNGVNNFMPHAFSMNLPGNVRKENEFSVPPGFCLTKLPPTFYMGGMNPQYEVFGDLMAYVQRVCHLLEDGIHLPDVAIYYNAEADWIGCDARNIDDVAMTLTQNNIDYDFIPQDCIVNNCNTVDGKLHVNLESYNAIIVPGSSIIPEKLLIAFTKLASKGVKIIFTDNLPLKDEKNNSNDIDYYNKLFTVLSLEELPQFVKNNYTHVVKLKENCEFLRFYNLKKDDNSFCTIFFNEGINLIDTYIKINGANNYFIYDPWNNKLYKTETTVDSMRLRLEPQQLLVVLSNVKFNEDVDCFIYDNPNMVSLNLDYDIYKKEYNETDFKLLRKNSKAVNLLIEEKLTRTCATFKYESVFESNSENISILEIPSCGDCARLWINNQYCGVQLGPKCTFEIKGKVKKGLNKITIETLDNPSYFDRVVEQGLLYGTKIPALMHGIYGNIKIG